MLDSETLILLAFSHVGLLPCTVKVLAGWMSDAPSIPCYLNTTPANRTHDGTAIPRFDGSVAGKGPNPPRGGRQGTVARE